MQSLTNSMSFRKTEIQDIDHLVWTVGNGARGVYPVQDTLRMETARVKQKEYADT